VTYNTPSFLIIMNHYLIISTFILLLFVSCSNNIEDDLIDSFPKEEPTQIMNLLDNGDCEKWNSFSIKSDGDYLYGWSLKNHSGTVYKEASKVYKGKYSAKLLSPKTGITAFISQQINVSPGHRIRIFFRYAIDYVSGNGARTYCYFCEGRNNKISNNKLSSFYDPMTLSIIRGGGYGLPKLPSETKEWQTFDYIIQVPAIANNFIFEIRSYAGTTLYVDDCYVIDLDM